MYCTKSHAAILLVFSVCFASMISAQDDPVAPLDRHLPDLRLNANSLSDVVDFFQDATGTNIFVDWRAVETAGVKRDTPITYRVHNIKFSKALTDTLATAAGDPNKLGYCYESGTVFISTADGAKTFSEQWKAHSKMPTDKLKSFPDTLPEFKFKPRDDQSKTITLSDMVDFLRDSTGDKVECDWDQMHSDGVEKDASIPARWGEKPTLLVLQLVAVSASNDKAVVDFRIDGDTIKFFSTPTKKH